MKAGNRSREKHGEQEDNGDQDDGDEVGTSTVSIVVSLLYTPQSLRKEWKCEAA